MADNFLSSREALTARRSSRVEVPLLVVLFLCAYGGGWWMPGESTAWLRLASWGAAHGWSGLERSSLYVTVMVTCIAWSGWGLRLYARRGGQLAGRRWAERLGLLCVCAPLGVLLIPRAAAVFLVGCAGFVLAGVAWHGPAYRENSTGFWADLGRESFPLLAAICFTTLSWQYNALWLMRGLLIAAGSSLVLRALLPAGE